jgi:hypothetical protein
MSLIRLGQIEHLARGDLACCERGATDQDGSYEFNDIPRHGDIELVWWGDQIVPGRSEHFDERLVLAGGQPIEIQIPRPGRIEGRVSRAKYPGALTVLVNRADGLDDLPHQVKLPAEQSDFEIGDLPAGKFVASLITPPEPFGEVRRGRPIRLATMSVEVSAGETAQLRFEE